MAGTCASPHRWGAVYRPALEESVRLAEGSTGWSEQKLLITDPLGMGWVWAGLRRHKGTAAVVWLAVTVFAAAWTSRLPALYRSEALVLVESRRIPVHLVPAAATPDINKTLELVRHNLLSSHELYEVVRALNPYPDRLRTGASDDSLLAQVRAAASISLPGASALGSSGPIRISFRHPEPETAARVANHLAVRFIEEITSARRKTHAAATRFLASHVASARRELELREAALREFRLRNASELPEQAEVLRAAAHRLRTELAALRGQIQALEGEKKALEQAAGTAFPTLQAAAAAPPPVPASGGTPGPSAHQSQIETLRMRLTALLAHYKPDHPDVRRVRAQLEEAQPLGSEDANQLSSAPKLNGVHTELPQAPLSSRADAVRLQYLEIRLKALAARQIQAAAELGITEQRLRHLPLREHELATLTREQAFFADQFRTLATRLQAAQMAAALERSLPPERAVLLEEARPSGKPEGRGRWAMFAAASLGGLLVGGLAAITRAVGVADARQPNSAFRIRTVGGACHRPYITA